MNQMTPQTELSRKRIDLVKPFSYLKSYLTSKSTKITFVSSILMYIAYALPERMWLNLGLIGTCIFLGVFLAFFSQVSNKFDDWILYKTDKTTLGKVGRYALQLIVNLGVFYSFLLSGVISQHNIDSLGGIFGIALLTTAASQGIQYVMLAFATRDIGNADLNVVIGIAFNTMITAFAAVGLSWMKPIFIVVGLTFGGLFFGIGVLSDLRSFFFPKAGIGIFFGSFNPFDNTHLVTIEKAIKERNLEKVYIHPTIISKIHKVALQKGHIVISHRLDGLRVYQETNEADLYTNYFPTGNMFYEYETRRLMIDLALKHAGLEEKVDLLCFSQIYDKYGFYGVLTEIQTFNPGKKVHGIYDNDKEGIQIRRIFDQSGWIYPISTNRSFKSTKTVPEVVEKISNALSMEQETITIDQTIYQIEQGVLIKVGGDRIENR